MRALFAHTFGASLGTLLATFAKTTAIVVIGGPGYLAIDRLEFFGLGHIRQCREQTLAVGMFGIR